MTTLVRWEPFRDIAQLQGEMSRLFDGLLDTGGRSAQTWVPPLDVWETGTEIVYAFDLPGLADPRTRAPVVDLSVHNIDAILWCTVSTQAWKESERIAWSHLPARLRGRGLLVSTHVDLLHDVRDAEKVLTRLRSAAVF